MCVEGGSDEAKTTEVNEETPEFGESPILKNILIKGEKVKRDPSQQTNMFRRICKCKGKYRNIIIYSDDTNNLVFKEMVEKLGFKIMAHPTPYQMTWMQKGHQILVNEHSKVEFQIGSYKDEALCDIICPWNFFMSK